MKNINAKTPIDERIARLQAQNEAVAARQKQIWDEHGIRTFRDGTRLVYKNAEGKFVPYIEEVGQNE